jgi:hypothetical protein
LAFLEPVPSSVTDARAAAAGGFVAKQALSATSFSLEFPQFLSPRRLPGSSSSDHH